jgi:hypothetical protein
MIQDLNKSSSLAKTSIQAVVYRKRLYSTCPTHAMEVGVLALVCWPWRVGLGVLGAAWDTKFATCLFKILFLNSFKSTFKIEHKPTFLQKQANVIYFVGKVKRNRIDHRSTSKLISCKLEEPNRLSVAESY